MKPDLFIAPLLLTAAIYLKFQNTVYESITVAVFGLGFTAYFLFLKSQKPLEDSIKIFLGLLIGFFFDSLYMNLNFYFYSLIDYPFMTYPPMFMALFWLIMPIHILNIKKHSAFYHFFFGAAHLLFLLTLQKFDLAFIEEPTQINTIALFFLWSLAYKIILKINSLFFSYHK